MCLSSKGMGCAHVPFKKNGRKNNRNDTANTKFLFERSYVIMKRKFYRQTEKRMT